jgi:hypothetical protein
MVVLLRWRTADQRGNPVSVAPCHSPPLGERPASGGAQRSRTIFGNECRARRRGGSRTVPLRRIRRSGAHFQGWFRGDSSKRAVAGSGSPPLTIEKHGARFTLARDVDVPELVDPKILTLKKSKIFSTLGNFAVLMVADNGGGAGRRSPGSASPRALSRPRGLFGSI